MMLRRAAASAVRSSRRHLSTQNFRYQALQTESASTAVVPTSTLDPSKFAQIYDKDFSDESVPDAPVPQSVRAIYHAPIKVPAQYGVPSCDLQIRSFTVKNVEFFCDFALRAAYYLRLPAFGPIPLPRRTERWTVPKSNFVHKKAQQNFERVTFKRLIQIKDGDPEVVQIWLAFLRKHEYHGIGMKANVYAFEKLGTGTVMAEKLAEIKQKAADGKLDHNQQLTAVRKAFNASHNISDTKPGSDAARKSITALANRINKLIPILGKSEASLNDLKNEVKKKGFTMGYNQPSGPRLVWDRPHYARKSWIQILERLEKETKDAALNMVNIRADMNMAYGKNWRSRLDLKPRHRAHRNKIFTAEDKINDSLKDIKGIWKTLHVEYGELWGNRLHEGRPKEKLWKERVGQKPLSEKQAAKSRQRKEVLGKLTDKVKIAKDKLETASAQPEILAKAEANKEPITATADVGAKVEAAHPEPTASEDAVAADKANVDLSHPDPLDLRTAKEIEVEATPTETTEASSTEIPAAEPAQETTVKKEDTGAPEPPQPTESESAIAADSELVPEPTQEATKEETPNAKEIQVEEATKKDN
ncbi:mitochondrial 37S ribosomal protein rsm10 [Orbilia oligospora]|uniref:Small ribosomal subunit protein uS10m n=1 Tax=Orbilia oligospora TaxID=2813651 RepID=A0A7C8V9K3_ORBOL|nr:mitochondrial 37S ribosomal protein rsm10 [Orbilia oligospora]